MLARFLPSVPTFETPPIWVHACSVGEVNTALPLLRALRQRWDQWEFLLTASTPAGHALAHGQAEVRAAWFPVDHPLTVSRFFTRLRPRALVLVETELWPGVLARAHAAGVPVVLVSGRLSEARARSYARTAILWRSVVRPMAAAAMQTATYADRMAGLGLDPSRISVTGNIKYDAAADPIALDERRALRASLAVPADVPVVVFGSAREGDEALAAACWAALQPRFPDLRMIVAPRHLDRVDAARRAFGDIPHRLRSESAPGAVQEAPVVILDTHGELGRIYGIASVAVVCGSFYPGVDGHNPLEPAAQGVATVFGPHMRNFWDIAAQLLDANGAVQVSGPEALPAELAALLADEPRRLRLGGAALDAVRANRGALARTLDFIAPVLEKAGVS